MAIRILFLAANPLGTDRLRLDEEVRTIDERLQAAHFRDRFELVQAHAVRYTDLSRYLLRYTPHIVHFSGHGSDEGQIIFEDRDGNVKPVSPKAIGGLFEVLKDNVRCVVLNACYSATQADAITEEIDCVVGMTRAIGDEAAIQFASEYYQALGYGRSVETAFKLGRNGIDLAGLGEKDTPQLLVKAGIDATNIIFGGETLPEPKAHREQTHERPVDMSVGASSLSEVDRNRRLLTMARKSLDLLELRSSGYTILTLPVELQIQLEAKREEVAKLEARLRVAEE